MEIVEIIALFRWIWVILETEEEAVAIRILLNRLFMELIKKFVAKVVEEADPAEQALIRVALSLSDYNYFEYESGKDAQGVRNAVNLVLHRYMACDHQKTWLDFGNVKNLTDPSTATLQGLHTTFSPGDFEFPTGNGKTRNLLPYIKDFFDTTGPNQESLRTLYSRDGKINPQDSVMYIFYMNVRRAMARYEWNNNVASCYIWPDLTNIPVSDYCHKPMLVDREMYKKKDDKDKDLPKEPTKKTDATGNPLPLSGSDRLEWAAFRKAMSIRSLKTKR